MKRWQDALLKPDSSILDAVQAIDKGRLQIALVTDPQKKLLGTVTDGDVRRGILKGISFKDPVSVIMNPNPVTARSNERQERVLELMKEKKIRQMPVLDANGAVVGVEIIEELIRAGARENLVVLMAGGLGTRLRPLTEELPKPLIHVGKKPMLETILENFIEYGFRDFCVTVNYKDHLIKEHFGDGSKWGVTLQYIHEDERRGTAGFLNLLWADQGLRKKLEQRPFFVMNGDVLTKVNFSQLLDFHLEEHADATMCVREYDFQVPYGVVKLDGHQIVGIDEKPVHKFFVNAGIYVLNTGIFNHMPNDPSFDMPELFKNMIKEGRKTSAFPVREYWIDVGRMNDLERANGEYEEVFS